jgi:prolyl 4-hydroxylase
MSTAMTLPRETVDWVKTQIEQGRSFLHIAKDLETEERPYDMKLIEAVAEIGNYNPESPMWMYGSHKQTHDRIIRVTYVFPCPRIALLDNVLSNDECDEIIARAKPKLSVSMITTADDKRKKDKNRKSQTAYLTRGSDEFIQRIDQRCADIMEEYVENGEDLQVVRYGTNGEYKPHYDYFPGPMENNRKATLLMYLNDVPEGGRTYFPGLKLAVEPKKGSALYFFYTDKQGRFDPQTLHGGEPVTKGEKWIVTKWARQKAYNPQ